MVQLVQTSKWEHPFADKKPMLFQTINIHKSDYFYTKLGDL